MKETDGAETVEIAALVDRFLSWPLPKSVAADLCATDANYPHPRCGTNLLTADEARQMLEHVLAAHPAMKDGWQPMLTAPLDGTEIELLVRHHAYWTALKCDGKEKADKEWQGPVTGKWIDHNGGGWTWRGHSGSPVAWRPLTAAERKS